MERLSQMTVNQSGYSLDLNNNFVLDNNICGIRTQFDSLIKHRYLNLAFKWNISQPEFMTQGIFIHCFQKSPTQFAMNLHRRPDNPIGKLLI